jgi:hypothetical protein
MFRLIVSKKFDIKKIMKPKKMVLLGRWEHRENERQRNIKSIWANSDNCGDRICGTPSLIHNIIENDKSCENNN